ncbi:transporter substrate-binding domain-containing protein [Bradyrhizobium sp. CCGUVB1N3]|uniref:transporter substrate-binding domain-containing protein n=1 Tax=Bradyrhizobium sp. CCGUVB1N3 TaxID=2949629 RepID=UPI0020B29CFF|nr:transporter substrate-binding domain-containing protein [Bradyrhizobium sp. CCGUVB1N3]MCP3474852.1 transporter substrate-binding domain-containing protein [Bradyrhizobium sp. CCGUVB1N3]
MITPKCLAAIAGLSFAMLGLPAIAQTKVDVPLPADLATPNVLTIGINCQYPPAGYVGLDGKPAGFEYGLVKRIAAFAFGSEAGLQTQCVNDSNRIPFLQSGKVDLVLASLARTPARAEQVDFSDPIWLSNLQLVVKKDSPINNYADLAGHTVVTVTGSTYQTWLQKCHPKANLITAQSPADASTMLVQGRSDAFAYIDVYDYNFVQNNKNFKVVGELASPAIQGIGVKKGNAAMLAWINAVIAKMREEDAFYKAFADEVKDPTMIAKYRNVVPEPKVKLDYAGVDPLECKS